MNSIYVRRQSRQKAKMTTIELSETMREKRQRTVKKHTWTSKHLHVTTMTMTLRFLRFFPSRRLWFNVREFDAIASRVTHVPMFVNSNESSNQFKAYKKCDHRCPSLITNATQRFHSSDQIKKKTNDCRQKPHASVDECTLKRHLASYNLNIFILELFLYVQLIVLFSDKMKNQRANDCGCWCENNDFEFFIKLPTIAYLRVRGSFAQKLNLCCCVYYCLFFS